MYMAVGRLEIAQFASLDFTLNFGILPEVRRKFVDWMKEGGDYLAT